MSNPVTKIKNRWDSMSVAARASIAYAVCGIVQRCISMINMPIFTRLMSAEEYGEMTIYSSWGGIFSIILTLNLAYGSFSSAMIKFEKERDKYISSIQGIWVVFAVVFAALYLPFRSFWNNIFDLPTLFVLCLIAETIGVNSINIWSGRKRFDFSYKPVVAVTLLMTVANTLLSLIMVLLSDNKGYSRVLGHIIATLAFGIAIFTINTIKGKAFFDKKFWKYALGFNIPLLAYYLSQVIFNQSDRLMINYYYGKDKAAIYSVAYTLATILTFVLNAINNSYVPWFYKKIKEGKEKENSKIATGISLLMSGLIACVVIAAPEIIYIFSSEEYAEAIWIVPPVAISLLLLFYAQLFINVQFYYEKKKSLIFASVFAAIANIILNVLLIPNISYIAAGYTTMISYIIFAVMNYMTMRKVAKEKGFSMEAINVKMLVLIFFAFSGLCFLMMALYNLIIIRYIIVAAGLTAAFIYRKKLKSFVSSIMKRKD